MQFHLSESSCDAVVRTGIDSLENRLDIFLLKMICCLYEFSTGTGFKSAYFSTLPKNMNHMPLYFRKDRLGLTFRAVISAREAHGNGE